MDQELRGLSFLNLDVELCPDPNPYYNFDLCFNIFEKQGRLILECEYSADLFDSETIRRWMGDYQTLLKGILAHPDLPISIIAQAQGTTAEEMVDLLANLESLSDEEAMHLVAKE
jgi:non-ribosomal peptide synthetase component F